MTMRHFILFEVNEVPFRVIDTYVERRPHSNFARLVDRAAQFTAKIRSSSTLGSLGRRCTAA